MAKKKAARPDANSQVDKQEKEYRYVRRSFTVGKKPDGSLDRVWVRGKTPAEADMKVAEARRMYARGLSLGDITVYEWSVRWMKVYKANVSANQKAHYQAKLDLDIIPKLGSMRMKDVRKSHLQEMLNKHKGGKKGTVGKIRIAIKQLFDDAEDEGIIERSPARKLELPELEEDSRRPLTCLEREAMLITAAKHPQGAYILTMYYCGLRRGEAIALTQADINLEKGELTIDKSIEFKGNVGELSSTKAAKLRKSRKKGDDELGARTVPIPDAFLPVLASACEGKEAGDILFPKGDGKHATKQTCTWWWRSFSRQCHIAAGAKLYRNAIQYESSPFGEEVTPHYLRHTYATDMYSAGIDEKARQEFLGHASKDVTDTYTKMSSAAFTRAAALLNDYHKIRGWCSLECVSKLSEKRQ